MHGSKQYWLAQQIPALLAITAQVALGTQRCLTCCSLLDAKLGMWDNKSQLATAARLAIGLAQKWVRCSALTKHIDRDQACIPKKTVLRRMQYNAAVSESLDVLPAISSK